MRALFAGLALFQILVQAELSSAQTGAEKCDLVAEKEFEYVSKLRPCVRLPSCTPIDLRSTLTQHCSCVSAVRQKLT